jgi:hypothetical protein
VPYTVHDDESATVDVESTGQREPREVLREAVALLRDDMRRAKDHLTAATMQRCCT